MNQPTKGNWWNQNLGEGSIKGPVRYTLPFWSTFAFVTQSFPKWQSYFGFYSQGPWHVIPFCLCVSDYPKPSQVFPLFLCPHSLNAPWLTRALNNFYGSQLAGMVSPPYLTPTGTPSSTKSDTPKRFNYKVSVKSILSEIVQHQQPGLVFV